MQTLFFIFQEKRKLQDETEAMSDRLSDESESRKKMADKLSHERHQNQKEKEATQEVRLPVAVQSTLEALQRCEIYTRSSEKTCSHDHENPVYQASLLFFFPVA